MFTASAIKNKATAQAYFDEHLSHNDYYTEGEVQPGYWIGEGASHLGLQEGSHVDQHAFQSLCNGQHPGSGEQLTLRQNAEGNRRIFLDFTCSAPKSVSVMAVTMDDSRLVEAHREASRIALKELERYATTRIRAKGADADRTTGNVVGAEFLHTSSRALDPQLHTHFTFFNATFDPKENRWKALQPGDLFAATKYSTEVYRNELCRRVQGLGYEMDGFEIKGVSAELRKRFSKRAAERDSVIKQMEERLGRKLSNKEVSWVVHQSRSAKLKGISTAEVRQSQLEQMTPSEIETLNTLRQNAAGFSIVSPSRIEPSAALDYAKAHVFERASVVPETEILRHALIRSRGQVDLENLKSQMATDTEFLRVGKEFSTREILRAEMFIIEKLNAGHSSFVPLATGYQPVNPAMGDDQRKAIAHVLGSPDQFTGFRGLAGAGKTTALKEIDLALQDRSRVFCAPTAAATDVLRKDGFEAVTLKALLVDPKQKQKLSRGSVIVVDEAGLVGLGDMKELFELAAEKSARVIFSGDTGQHAGVARGDALRLLEEHSLYRYGQLDRIRRQQQSDYRQTVELAAQRQPQKAFDKLDALGWVEEPAQIYEAAASAYLGAKENGRSALLVAPTWGEIESVTESVRAKLKAQGALSAQEEKVAVFDSSGWTKAQKSNVDLYQLGQRILFQKRTGSFHANEEVEVMDVRPDRLRVRGEDGKERTFRPGSGDSFDVGERRELALAPGDQILFQANRKQSSGTLVVNGQIATVKAVKNGQVTLTDGRVLPADYRQFTHGYCVTSHAAQSRTVDSVFVVASSHSGPAIHREQFYVSISRGRQNCRIFTDDKMLLRDRIAHSNRRRSALDLFKKQLVELGFSPLKENKSAPPPEQPSRFRKLRPLPRPTLSPNYLIEVAQRAFHQLVSRRQKLRPVPAPQVEVPQEKTAQAIRHTL
ncbi:MobF family relaxase [soil metagenome]